MTDETRLYTVRVPYTHADCCRSIDEEATIEIRAKSDEEARDLAKRAIGAVGAVVEVHSTQILNPRP